jgi:pimeloyl-ACP methyl ester carboxylesterase
MTTDLILLHGLWAPALAMSALAARLGAHGYRCHSFHYGGWTHPIEVNAERLGRFARDIGKAHFVGHSLGGLVILEALGGDSALEVGGVVLLGTPASGSFSGRRLARNGLGRWMLGRSEALWREARRARWTRPEPLGVVAGSMPIGLGRAIGRLPGANDGVVCVAETDVEGMRDRVVLPVSHSAMVLSARVAAQIVQFLRDGRFQHAAM